MMKNESKIRYEAAKADMADNNKTLSQTLKDHKMTANSWYTWKRKFDGKNGSKGKSQISFQKQQPQKTKGSGTSMSMSGMMMLPKMDRKVVCLIGDPEYIRQVLGGGAL